MLQIPVEEIDLLIVDELGKIVSGDGTDTNVTRTGYATDFPKPERPHLCPRP